MYLHAREFALVFWTKNIQYLSNNWQLTSIIVLMILSFFEVPNYLHTSNTAISSVYDSVSTSTVLHKRTVTRTSRLTWFWFSVENKHWVRCCKMLKRFRITQLFRPPFINGRPQDSDSVFWKALPPVFESKCPFFIYIIFNFFHSHHL